MRWLKPAIRHSISAILGAEMNPTRAEALEPIRQAMLQALGEDGARQNPQLCRRLAFTHDAYALWYARSDLVAALSQMHGEAKAVATVQDLLPVFKGVLPRSMTETCRAPR